MLAPPCLHPFRMGMNFPRIDAPACQNLSHLECAMHFRLHCLRHLRA